MRSSLLHTSLRGVACVAAGAAAVLVPALPALAAAPVNDTSATAVAVSLGDHVELDTTEATTDASDSDLNAYCGAPVTKASVWYSYTPAVDGGVVLDMTSSDYSGGFLVFQGAPTADSLVDCGPGVVGFSAYAGSTYYVMVIDDDEDGNTANGGHLVMDVNEAPPPPTIDVTVAPTGKVDRSGTAWISGSYTCTDADFVDLEAQLTQQVGRFKVTGYGYTFGEGTCDGTAQPFTIGITSDNGTFAGGKAASVVFSYACGAFDCVDGYVEQTVMLRGGGR